MLSMSDTSKRIFFWIVIILMATGVLAMVINRHFVFRKIDERSDWMSSTYEAEAGGWKFSFNSEYDNPWLRMKVKEPGWYNFTYYYFDGDKGSQTVYACEKSERCNNTTIDEGMLLMRGERSDGWIVINSIGGWGAEKFPAIYHRTTELEKIEVDGEMGYFKTSWKEIEVDRWDIL